jgi:hypothetical protein
MNKRLLQPQLLALLAWVASASSALALQTLYPAGTALNSPHNYTWNRMSTINVSSGEIVPFVTYKFNTLGVAAGNYTFTMTTVGFAGAINMYSVAFDPTFPQANFWQNGVVAGGPGVISQIINLPTSQFFEVVFSAATAGSSGTFTATVTGPANLVLSPVANTTIRVQPQSQTILSGTSANLLVYADGPLPHTWQWYNGTSPSTANPIAGATNHTYATPVLITTNSYWVRVVGPSGTVNSSTAVITTTGNPNANYSGTLAAGGCTLQNGDLYATQNFQIQQSGTYTFTITPGFSLAVYQGSFDPLQPLANYFGTGNGSYVPGSYVLVISKASPGGGFSGAIGGGPAVVNLTAGLPPQFVSGPYDRTILNNTATTLAVATTCGTPFTLQWYRGTPGFPTNAIATATNSTYTTPALASDTTYWARMIFAGGTNDSQQATVFVVNGAVSTSGTLSACDHTFNRPSAAGVLSGQNCPYKLFTFTPSVAGTYTFSTTPSGFVNRSTLYGGSFDPSNPLVNLYTLTNSPNPLTTALLANQTYFLVISSANAGESGSFTTTVTAGPALVTHRPPPAITTHPASTNIFRGQATTLSVVSPTPNVTYQWYQGGTCFTRVAIPGATDSSYTTPPLTAYVDYYWVEVSGQGGYTLANPATVGIRPQVVTDSYNATEDVPLTIGVPGVLANDIKADGAAIYVTFYTLPTNGTVVVFANGSFNYTSATNNFGPDSFTYQISDGRLDSIDFGLVNLTISEVNDPPVRTAGSVKNLTVLQNDPATSLGLSGVTYGPGGGADEAGQTLTYQVTAVPPPALGNVLLADGVTTVLSNSTYTLTQIRGLLFKPATNALGGPEPFTFTVTDNGTTAGVPSPQTLTQSLYLTINAPAAITGTAPQLPNGLLISGSGTARQSYTLQTSTNLVNWLWRATVTANDAGLWQWLEPDLSESPARFYRVLAAPQFLSGLINWWNADGDYFDAFGGLHGTPINGVGFASGQRGSAFSFDGAGAAIQLSGGPIPVPWTACFWVNRQDSPAVSAALLTDTDTGLKLEQYGSRQVGFTQFGVADYYYGYSVPTDVWTHLAFVGTPGSTTLYVNAVAVETIGASIDLPRGTVGSRPGGADLMKGLLDEATIFNRALSPAEIQQVLNATSGP